MESIVPPGGGTGVLDRKDEGYGGTVINVVLDFEGVFTLKKEHSDFGRVTKIDFEMGDGMTMPMYLNETLIETLLKPLIAMKYFKLWWNSPWAAQINAHLQAAEGVTPLEIIPAVDPSFYMEYMQIAESEQRDATESLPAIYKAFEFDHRPLAWIGVDLKVDAYMWSMFVRPNTTVHGVINPSVGISGEECNLVLAELNGYLG